MSAHESPSIECSAVAHHVSTVRVVPILLRRTQECMAVRSRCVMTISAVHQVSRAVFLFLSVIHYRRFFAKQALASQSCGKAHRKPSTSQAREVHRAQGHVAHNWSSQAGGHCPKEAMAKEGCRRMPIPRPFWLKPLHRLPIAVRTGEDAEANITSRKVNVRTGRIA